MKNKRLLSSIFLVSLTSVALFSQHTGLEKLTGQNNFSFEPVEKKTLPGKSPANANNGAIDDADKIGSLALVSLFYQNGCYIDGNYNHNDFAVERGSVTSGIKKFEAYRVYEPSHKATKFLASEHNICYRFSSKQDYSVYLFENNSFNKLMDIPAKDIKTGTYSKINNLTVSKLKGNAIYVFVPSATRLSVSNQIAPGIEGSLVSKTNLGNIYNLKYSVKGEPFNNIEKNYSENRHYFSFGMEGGKTGIIWQESEKTTLHLTVIENDVTKFKTIDLPNPNSGFLAAANGSSVGQLYYLTISEDLINPLNVMLCKHSLKTGANIKTQLDVSSKGLNMFAFKKEVASLNISGDKLLLMIARTMHKSSDGLNHQGGIAVLFGTAKLDLIKNYGQTSGHSFDNFLMISSTGEFIGMDLGDNYPRGINLHRFDDYMHSKLVYSFKTEHGTTADCWGIKTFPEYNEISTPAKKYYKWSNDNNTYTELGNIAEADDGYLISFLGEPDKDGKALNNKEVGIRCSRNVGFVKVKKEFFDGGNDVFLSKGITEKGGFYSFGGSWSEQSNTGIVWLTKYRNPDTENAKFLKTVKLQDGNFLFLWEFWDGDGYKTTLAQKTDKDGKPLGSVVDLGKSVNLDRRDDLLVKDNQVLIFTGNEVEKKLDMTIIEIKK